MKALGNEYTKLYNKTPLTITKRKYLWFTPKNIPIKPFKQPPQCMPYEYKDECSIQADWNYYIGEKLVVSNLKTEKLDERRPKTTN